MFLWLLLELGPQVTEHGGYSEGSPKFILHGWFSWQTCSWCGSQCWAGWWISCVFGHDVGHGLGQVLEPAPEPHSPKMLQQQPSCFSVEGSAPLAEHRAPPAALQAEQQQFGSSWSVGFALLMPGLSSSSSRELQMGQPWEGSAPPALGLGTPELPGDGHPWGLLCAELSVLWSLFEVCLKPPHIRRSWKLPA